MSYQRFTFLDVFQTNMSIHGHRNALYDCVLCCLAFVWRVCLSAVGVPWHKASLPPPPPWRHGTARHKTGRHAEIPTPPPHLTLLH